MLNQKKLFNWLFFTSCLVIFTPFFLNLENYVGSKFLFFLFNLSSFGLFLTAIRKNANSFEFFFIFCYYLVFGSNFLAYFTLIDLILQKVILI